MWGCGAVGPGPAAETGQKWAQSLAGGSAMLTWGLSAESGQGLQGGCGPPSVSRRGPGRRLS